MDKIITYGNSLLAKKSETVQNINGKIKEITQKMFKIMYKYKGIGLAAVQMGIPKRIIVLDTSVITDEDLKIGKPLKLALINPEIVDQSERWESLTEGCLSVPGITAPVSRKFFIELKAWTLEEKEINLRLYALNARVAQHEIDHTNGILFIDRLDKVVLKKLKKDLCQLKKR